MPRKKPDPLGGQHLVGAVKRVEVPVQTALPNANLFGPITCPACKSKISADGKTLHEKSSYLDELVETDAGVDEVEKKIEKMQKTVTAHEATIADLRSQLEEAKKKPTLISGITVGTQQEREKPNVGKKGTEGREPKPSWWD